MLTPENLTKELNQFGRLTVRDARRGFARQRASGKGQRSINYQLEVFKTTSFSLAFEMEDYVEYQDKGVSGVKKKYNTPYKYTNKMPPASAFDRWSVRRGIAPRNQAGRFLPRKAVNFALARHIYNYGIRPKKFFTDAFTKNFKGLPDDLIEAYGLDLEKFIASTLNAKVV